METTNTFLASLKITILFLLISLFGCQQKEETIRVAFNLPLTGELSTYGVSIRDGARLAFDDLSSKYESDRININYRVDFQDNGGIARNAGTIFQRQRAQGYDFYVSGVKPQTMAIIDNVSSVGKPHFVWIFDAFVTSNYPNTYRTWVNYKYESIYYLKYIDVVRPEKVAIIYVNLPHTVEQFNDLILPELNERNIENVLIEQYPIDKNEFRDIAIKLRQFNPDLIIINGFKSNLLRIIPTFREYNLIKAGNTICTFDFLDAAEDLSNELKEGIRFVAPRFETREPREKTSDFRNRFNNRFNRSPRYTDAYAYDLMMVIDNLSVNSKLMNGTTDDFIQNLSFEGVTGYIEFDETGDIILELDVAYFENGILKYELLEQ